MVILGLEPPGYRYESLPNQIYLSWAMLVALLRRVYLGLFKAPSAFSL